MENSSGCGVWLAFIGIAPVIFAPVSCVLLTYFQSLQWKINRVWLFNYPPLALHLLFLLLFHVFFLPIF